MSAISIVVEGKDDIVFVRRLIEVFRAQSGKAPLEWKLFNTVEKITIDAGVFGNCYCESNGVTSAIFENKGAYGDINPAAKVFNLGKKSFKVTDIICLYDADAPTNFLGNTVNHGGFSARNLYLSRKLSSLSCGHKHFLFPDNQSDGTLEDLALSIMKPSIGSTFNPHWSAFRANVQIALSQSDFGVYPYSAKCSISQCASVLDTECAKDLYWVAALWNDGLWDWTSSKLTPIKNFLQTVAPSLFV